jgi:hypothetical protein
MANALGDIVGPVGLTCCKRLLNDLDLRNVPGREKDMNQHRHASMTLMSDGLYKPSLGGECSWAFEASLMRSPVAQVNSVQCST